MDTFGLTNYLGSVAQAEEEKGEKIQKQIAATSISDLNYQSEKNRQNADENQEKSQLQGLLDIGGIEVGKEGLKSLKEAGSKLLRNKLKEYGIDAEDLKDKGYKQLKGMVKAAKKKAQDAIDSVKSKVQGQVDNAKSKLQDTADDLQNKVSDVQDDIQSKIGDVKSQVDGKINDVGETLEDAKTGLSDIAPEIDQTAIPSTLSSASRGVGLDSGSIELGGDDTLDYNSIDNNLSNRLVSILNKNKIDETPSSLDVDFNQPADILGRPIGKASMPGAEDATSISEDTQKFLSGYSDDSVSFMNKMNLEDKIRGRVFKGGKTDITDNSDVLGDGEKLFNRMNAGEDLGGVLKPEEIENLKSLRGTIRQKILSKLEGDTEMDDFAAKPSVDEPEIPDAGSVPDLPSKPDIRAPLPEETQVSATDTSDLAGRPPDLDAKPAVQETTVDSSVDTATLDASALKPTTTAVGDVGEDAAGKELVSGTQADVETDIESAAKSATDVGESAGEGLAEGAAEAGEIEAVGGGPEDIGADVGAAVALIGGALGGIFGGEGGKKKPDTPPPPPIVKQLILNPSQQLGI